MKSHVACLVLTSLCLAFGGSAAAQQGPARDVPELQPLSHWAGVWDGELSIKPNAGLPKGGRGKGASKGEWAHDGRFLRQTWKMEGGEGLPNLSGSSMMTYDPRKKVYRNWTFFSTGAVMESQGVWDAKTKTMTWTGRDAENGHTSVIRASFGTDGTETFTIVETDRAGKVVSEVSGKNVRRPK
jgi:hypothetical protein